MPDPLKRLKELLAKHRASAAEQYIMGLPGVGKGMLDSLEALYGAPITFDTSSADPRAIGQMQRGGGRIRVLLNPRAFEDIAQRGASVEREAPLTLVHEVLGHGAGKLGSSPEEELAADLIGESWLRLTGRNPTLPAKGTPGMLADAALRDLLTLLQGPTP